MTPKYAETTLAGLVVGFALLATPAWSADSVRVRVRYVINMDMVEPRQRPNYRVPLTVGAILTRPSKVRDYWLLGADSQRATRAELASGNWRVAAPNELVRTARFQNNITTVHVTVDGKSCHATVTSQLRSGRSVYTFINGIRATRVAYEDVQCSIE